MCDNPDICIIGSGASGSFLVHELKGSGHSIVILETGNNKPDSAIDSFISKLNIHDQSHLNYGFSRQLGGSTNLWAGRVAPFEEVDFQKKTAIPDSGWPIDLKDLIPFYDRVSCIMGLPLYKHFKEKAHHSSNKRVENIYSTIARSSLDIKSFIWSSPPFNARKTILEDVVGDDQIEIRKDSHVTRLIENRQRDKIITVEYIDASGALKKMSPNKVVLAAGGVENARILLNSTSESKSGIANEHDVVGRYFSTHPKADMGVLMLKKAIPLDSPLFLDVKDSGLSSRLGVGINQKVQKKEGYLNHYVQLTPMLEYTASTLFEKIKDSSALNSQLINKSRVMRGVLPGIGLLVYEIIGRLAGLQKKSSKFILRAFLDQYPHREHRVKLSNELDAYGYPKVEINWKFTDQDKSSTLDFFKFINDTFESNGLGSIEYSKLEEVAEWPIIAIHSHFMGSTRMGNDPKTSVVDSNCQVHGYENLFVAGPSVFPTYGYANPVYTIAALSLRLAVFLKRSCRQ